MFLEQGYDAVTVAAIAQAAEVSKMTVFNHFARKEDLLIDRQPEAIALLTEAVRGRPAGTDSVLALRKLAISLVQQRNALSGIRDGTDRFLRTVLGSADLRARARELTSELEAVLAALLTEQDDPAIDLEPALLAAFVMAAYRTLYVQAAAQILSGAHADDVAADHLVRVDTAFNAVAAAATSAHRHVVPG